MGHRGPKKGLPRRRNCFTDNVTTGPNIVYVACKCQVITGPWWIKAGKSEARISVERQLWLSMMSWFRNFSQDALIVTINRYIYHAPTIHMFKMPYSYCLLVSIQEEHWAGKAFLSSSISHWLGPVISGHLGPITILGLLANWMKMTGIELKAWGKF